MAPKESAAARKLREKQERFAAQQHQERLDCEIDEERSRSNVELIERVGRAECFVQFYEVMINPINRLMVTHAAFDRLRLNMQHEGALSAQRLLEMQTELRRVEKSGEALLHEIVLLRGDVRGVLARAASSLQAMRSSFDKAIENFLVTLNESRAALGDPLPTLTIKAQELDVVLDDVRRKHADIARTAQAKVTQITSIWQEKSSMHTRIPQRIRKTLEGLDKEELLLILDTLSFEEPVRKYLLYRYPPGTDDPMAMDSAAVALLAPAGTAPLTPP